MYNKTEDKLFINKYMDKYDISYVAAKILICKHLITWKEYIKEKQVTYGIACIADDNINNYNISTIIIYLHHLKFHH